ncbi:Isochorismatase hydrolase [Aspergillus heteromorphus CBS 117.55]|uniref:Isochorismatase hydrolase n=1 Tax=Aspergillus heteromorphus CBS 117.55 TaxID=1448321 RepID=A0A317UXH1_9EURO|nr:Isochorismatase hydrolase [Aspergillus heteromorphus CBS 117.55]PWY66733.1 Isochorismatase hydrolase [Aspergillus heteromorphus CBS 117.55]
MKVEKPTLILLDIQNGVVERLNDTDAYLARCASVIQAARDANIYIVHVVTGFRPGYPECNPRNSSVVKVKAWGSFLITDPSSHVHPLVAPTEDEPIVIKRRVSAFFTTDLDLLLRAAGTTEVVVTGLISSGAVLSTVRSAADLDYKVTVLEDMCMDRDQELHDVLMTKIFPRQGRVMQSGEWLEEVKEKL